MTQTFTEDYVQCHHATLHQNNLSPDLQHEIDPPPGSRIDEHLARTAADLKLPALLIPIIDPSTRIHIIENHLGSHRGALKLTLIHLEEISHPEAAASLAEISVTANIETLVMGSLQEEAAIATGHTELPPTLVTGASHHQAAVEPALHHVGIMVGILVISHQEI